MLATVRWLTRPRAEKVRHPLVAAVWAFAEGRAKEGGRRSAARLLRPRTRRSTVTVTVAVAVAAEFAASVCEATLTRLFSA